MEAVWKIAAVAVTAAVLGAVLRRQTPELALLLGLMAGLWCVGVAVNALGAAAEVLGELIHLTGLEEELLTPVVKVVALSLVTRVTGEVCRSAGEHGIAAFAETAGAVLALGISLPLLRAVILLMGELLG